MNRKYPIYTEKTDCRDCYKCVRRCPVKAIKIENGSATVMAERCIACGLCVHVCPAGAKKVRNDLVRAKSLLKRNGKVVASLAPSFASEWPEVEAGAMAGALKQLGFHAASETALGAEAVSHALAVGDELVDEIGPDVTGGAGDEDRGVLRVLLLLGHRSSPSASQLALRFGSSAPASVRLGVRHRWS